MPEVVCPRQSSWEAGVFPWYDVTNCFAVQESLSEENRNINENVAPKYNLALLQVFVVIPLVDIVQNGRTILFFFY